MAQLRIARTEIAPPAGEALTLVAWNLGYAGLGAESDFVSDGGKSTLPPSIAATRKNLRGIIDAFDLLTADVYILPETAKAGLANYWCDLDGALNKRLRGCERVFHPDFVTRGFPPPLRVEHGLSIHARRHIVDAFSAPLTLEGRRFAGFVKRDYAATIVRLASEGAMDWIIVGVHLAAFDEGGAVRKRQLAEVLEIARRYYDEGHPVVMGGDFNLVLAQTAFPTTTEEKYLFWLHEFPMEALGEGWRIAADPSVGSVRTNERAYLKGENHTAVIDGFIVSPGVVIESVATTDLDFQYSDHQPVKIRVRRPD